jgi:hypothetical protein
MKDPKTGKRPRIKKEKRYTDSEIELARKKFMGKKVRVKKYKGSDGRVSDWVGNCYFLGYNKYLPSWGFQITINRTPLSNIRLDQIELEK